ncbi:hypothetical protein GGS23DRAFT_471437 [Durotheca rogersii]|uniref:uncharacterized protein n=1 Tax=Durotheca rogersii TaxID=419775 RepID=UPI00221ED303|nr:uncharacterized protein GGS23DRAFT_471437 [Durotheca rogersii]KAI5855004.1 hypothetical protein GGS23DRAFT_471437 [Durotheca rogersii]
MGLQSSFGDKMKKKLLRKTFEKAIDFAARASPVVKTIQAAHGLTQVGGLMNQTSDFLPKAAKAAQAAEEFIPAMQVMGQSLCDSVKLFAHFSAVASAVGIGTNMIMTYQGVQALQLIAARLQDISDSLAAQAALMAQRDFPELVYYMIREQLSQTADDPDRDHWFFVYHPDNDWYPRFFHLVEERPLDPRFCGYTNQIDTAFVFMLAARNIIEKRTTQARRHGGKPPRPTRIHLLIPAYQPILVAEALRIPDEIGDFVMEGRVHNTREFVWFNLPPEQRRRYVKDIGHWVPPTQGWWDWAMSKFSLAGKPPRLGERRTLGTRQQPLEIEDSVSNAAPAAIAAGASSTSSNTNADDDDAATVVSTNTSGSSSARNGSKGSRNIHQATPLHNRRQRKK